MAKGGVPILSAGSHNPVAQPLPTASYVFLMKYFPNQAAWLLYLGRAAQLLRAVWLHGREVFM
jgi:hypothetical protein